MDPRDVAGVGITLLFFVLFAFFVAGCWIDPVRRPRPLAYSTASSGHGHGAPPGLGPSVDPSLGHGE